MNKSALITPTVPTADQPMVDAIFSQIEAHLGFVPDGLKLYGISPKLLENFVGNVGYFMNHPTLSQELLAMTRYLVSSRQKCAFCIDFNQAILINLGKTQAKIDAAQKNIDDAPLSSNELILLKIALTSISTPEAISQTDMDKARAAGYSEREIFDIVVIASNNKAFTDVLRTFKVEAQGTFA